MRQWSPPLTFVLALVLHGPHLQVSTSPRVALLRVCKIRHVTFKLALRYWRLCLLERERERGQVRPQSRVLRTTQSSSLKH
ncbi:hypothetical protein C8Q78DRAFT_1004348 [Trametes maxima]|nr:hypothetical protein C8Q78DRAFT_1004348 [Trametes maxima]